MPNRPEYAGRRNLCQSPLVGNHGLLRRQPCSCPQVLRHQQGVDARGISPDDAILVAERNQLRLVEVAWRQQFADRIRLAHVVQAVFCNHLGIAFVQLRDFGWIDVGPVGGGNSEMACDGLESVAVQSAIGHIVQHHQMVGIDHMPPRDVIPRVVHHSFADGEPAGTGFRHLVVSSQGELDLMPFASCFQILKVEIMDIMPFDRIRIAFLDDFDHRFQQVFLASERLA